MQIILEEPRIEEVLDSEWIDPIRTARAILAEHDHFAARTHRFEFERADEVLLVRGQVPSFYLKQLLQAALQEVAGIERIENQVAVICSDGLSSVGGDR
ncbi:MAG: hypothetical protein AB7G28_13250 [Pirellulales bacterium]